MHDDSRAPFLTWHRTRVNGAIPYCACVSVRGGRARCRYAARHRVDDGGAAHIG